jgi:hypothetical protein
MLDTNMHLRVSRTVRAGHAYEYAQIVQSYRRPDGVTAQKVIASLGALPALDLQNLRAALEASRSGHAVVLPSRLSTSRTRANLQYLDVAAALSVWRWWGLDQRLERLLPSGDATVRLCDVLAALVIQRAVDPGSKLEATRWFPRTALPELLGVSPRQFNNTRVHRVLDALDDAVDERLQDSLSEHYRGRRVVSKALFVDLTDTWFVGEGPKKAEHNKTKEGLYRRKIGIALACDEHGYPVRWRVVRGREAEPQTVFAMLETALSYDWIGERPVVCDRALGTSEYLLNLTGRGVRFVTALRRTEFDAYTQRIPVDALSSVSHVGPDAVARASAAIQPHLARKSDSLYVLDLGQISRDELEAPPRSAEDKTVEVMRQVREMLAGIESGRAANLREAGRRFGLRKQYASKLYGLRHLQTELQDDVLAGGAAGVSLLELRRIAAEPDARRQREAYAAAVQQVRTRPDGRTSAPRGGGTPSTNRLRVRAVLSFNPQTFVDQRRSADKGLARAEAAVRKLVRETRDPERLRRRVDSLLEHLHLRTLYRFEAPDRLVLDEGAWKRRRRFDGFSLIVAHPDIEMEAEPLVRLYRSKDAVEKDFQTMKSAIRLRPVRHRDDDKVRAHVSLCVLALLLERTLEARLREAGHPTTAPMLFEELRSAHLNLLDLAEGPGAYDLTQASPQQAELVKALGLSELLDAGVMAAKITPR